MIDPVDYAQVLSELKASQIERATKFRLAKKVFAHTAAYDGMITNHLTSLKKAWVQGRRSARPQGLLRRVQPGQLVGLPRTCATARTRTSGAAFYRDASPVAAPWRTTPAAGKGARTTTSPTPTPRGMRQDLRRPGLRDHQARQPFAAWPWASRPWTPYDKAFKTDSTSRPSAASSPSTARLTARLPRAVVKQFVEVIIAPSITAEAPAKSSPAR